MARQYYAAVHFLIDAEDEAHAYGMIQNLVFNKESLVSAWGYLKTTEVGVVTSERHLVDATESQVDYYDVVEDWSGTLLKAAIEPEDEDAHLDWHDDYKVATER